MQSIDSGIGNLGPQIVTYTEFPPGRAKIVPLKVGRLLSHQLMEMFPDRCGGMHFKLWRNSPSHMTTMEPMEADQLLVVPSDFFVIQFHPAGSGNILPIIGMAIAAIIIGVVTWNPYLGAAVFAIGVGAMVAANALMTVPAVTPDTQTNKTSGSNYLDHPSNQMRNGSRVPEVFGKLRVWPDLISPAYVEYGDNYMQKGISYYCVSEGYCDLEDHKLDVTPLQGYSEFAVTVIRGDTATLPRIKIKRANVLGNNINLPKDEQTDYFTLIGDQVVEIHWEVYFPKGLLMYKTGGGINDNDVEIKIYWQRINDDDSLQDAQSEIISVGGQYENPWVKTIIKTVSPGRYRASVVKNDEGRKTADNIAVTDAQLAAISGVEYVDGMPTKGRTYVRLEYNRNAVSNQTSILFSYNCIATRYLPYIVPTAQSIADCEFIATPYIKDCLAYTLYSQGTGAGVPFAQIDVESLCACTDYLYGVSEILPEFNSVLDKFMSIEEQLGVMATSCRISVSNHYGKFYFTVDQPQTLPVALFNRRNRMADDESALSIAFRSGDEPDCVQIDWKDSQDAYQPKTYTYPTDVQPYNPKKVDGTGLIYEETVYRRARYEWDSLKNRRRIKSVKVTEEAQMLLPLDLVAVVEPWNEVKLDGEVQFYDAATRTCNLDKNLDFDTSNMTIRFRSLDGTKTSPLIAFTVNPEQVYSITLAVDPPFEIGGRDEPTRQLGNLFDIGVEDYHNKRLWLVTRGEITKTSVNLTLIEYAPSVYACDTEEVPT